MIRFSRETSTLEILEFRQLDTPDKITEIKLAREYTDKTVTKYFEFDMGQYGFINIPEISLY